MCDNAMQVMSPISSAKGRDIMFPLLSMLLKKHGQQAKQPGPMSAVPQAFQNQPQGNMTSGPMGDFIDPRVYGGTPSPWANY